MCWPPWKPKPHVPMTILGLRELDIAQLALLEEAASRQESGMKDRISAASTRAAILVAASAVLSGTELVTSSGLPWLSALSLAFYLIAAILGLVATRSRLMLEPHLEMMIPKYYTFSTITLRRSMLLSRLDAHDTARRQVNQRHYILVWGYSVLLVAWLLSAASTTYAFFNPDTESPTQIQIVDGTE